MYALVRWVSFFFCEQTMQTFPQFLMYNIVSAWKKPSKMTSLAWIYNTHPLFSSMYGVLGHTDIFPFYSVPASTAVFIPLTYDIPLTQIVNSSQLKENIFLQFHIPSTYKLTIHYTVAAEKICCLLWSLIFSLFHGKNRRNILVNLAQMKSTEFKLHVTEINYWPIQKTHPLRCVCKQFPLLPY